MNRRSQRVSKKKILNQFPQPQNEVLQEAVNACYNYKLSTYERFLFTKEDLKEIKHRKIVQKIFQKYIPQQQLILDCSNYIKYNNNSSLSKNPENLKIIGDSLKLLPNIQHIYLDLNYNQLGKNKEDLKQLEYMFKQLVNVKYLDLDLSRNYLGDKKFEESLKHLTNALKQLPNLKNLSLNLSHNDFVPLFDRQGKNLKYLKNVFKILPYDLDYLELDLNNNNLGQNCEGVKFLCDALNYLPQNLQNFSLQIENNYLGVIENYVQILENGLEQLPKTLKSIILNFKFNMIENIPFLRQSFKQQQNIQHLELNFVGNKLGQQVENQQYLRDCIKQLPYSLQHLELNLTNNQIQNDHLEYLAQGLKQLQTYKNLKIIGLNLTQQDIIIEDSAHIKDIIMQLPNNLEQFDLILQHTYENQSIKNLTEGLEQLPANLKHLALDLSNNKLQNHQQNLTNLGNALKQLLNLEFLQLDLQNNDLDTNNNLIFLADAFKQLQNLKELHLDLSNTKLYQQQGNYTNLINIFQSLSANNNLQYLTLSFNSNCINKNINSFGESLKELPNNLQHLCLNLYNNYIDGRKKQSFVKKYLDVLEKQKNIANFEYHL